VFELAEGDIRSSVVSKNIPHSWRFTVLHQTTLGLMQLHSAQIAHQDIKPSNVLLFNNGDLKVGDLGRATRRAQVAPHDTDIVAGGIKYAPFEQRYGFRPSGDWAEMRISYDVFNLGTLLTFIFTANVLPSKVLSTIEPHYHPDNWGGSYADVQPFLQSHLVKTVQEFSDDLPSDFRDELTKMILDLCHVYPAQRGRWGSKTGKPNIGPLWLEKYVSRFDVMHKKAVLQEKISNA
jgi:serine/threonine protein kinase